MSEAALAVDGNWKAKRSDWKPYDPSVSLAQNKLRAQDRSQARQMQLAQTQLIEGKASKTLKKAKHSMARSAQNPEPDREHTPQLF